VALPGWKTALTLEGERPTDDVLREVPGAGDRHGAQAVLRHHNLHDPGGHVLRRSGDVEEGLALVDISGAGERPDLIQVGESQRSPDEGRNGGSEVVGVQFLKGAGGDPGLSGHLHGKPLGLQSEGAVHEHHAPQNRQEDRIGAVRTALRG
jgi:hypothetical protein